MPRCTDNVSGHGLLLWDEVVHEMNGLSVYCMLFADPIPLFIYFIYLFIYSFIYILVKRPSKEHQSILTFLD